MKNLPTLFLDKQELLLDLDIYGKIVSTPQTSREDLAQLMFEEFKFTHPLPSMENERYKLSDCVSTDYKIEYDSTLELQENESLVDLQQESDQQTTDIFKIEVPKELQALFTYGKPVDEEYKLSLMEKFSLLDDEDDFNRGIATTEKLYGSVEEEASSILSDEEIDNIGYENDEEEEIDEEVVDYSDCSDDEDVDYYDDSAEDEDSEYYDMSADDEDDFEDDSDEDYYGDDEFDNAEPDLNDNEENNQQYTEEVEEDYEEEDDFEDYSSDDYSDDELDDEELDFDEDSSIENESEDDDSEDDDYEDCSYEDEDDSEDDDFEDYSSDTYEDEDEDDTYEGESSDTYEDDEDLSSDDLLEEEPVPQSQEVPQTQDNFIDDDFEMSFEDESVKPQFKPKPAPLTENGMFGAEKAQRAEIKKEIQKLEPKSSEFGDNEPTELRAFLRKHPKCEMSIVLKYFSKKEVEQQIRMGKVIKRGNTLRI